MELLSALTMPLADLELGLRKHDGRDELRLIRALTARRALCCARRAARLAAELAQHGRAFLVRDPEVADDLSTSIPGWSAYLISFLYAVTISALVSIEEVAPTWMEPCEPRERREGDGGRLTAFKCLAGARGPL